MVKPFACTCVLGARAPFNRPGSKYQSHEEGINNDWTSGFPLRTAPHLLDWIRIIYGSILHNIGRSVDGRSSPNSESGPEKKNDPKTNSGYS